MIKHMYNNESFVDQNQSNQETSGIRMLMYSHDSFGLGHLQRCLKISRVLLDCYQDLSILLVTGSAVVHRFELPPRLDYVKLPAVRKVGPESYESRLLEISHSRILELRSSILLETVKAYQPHILLVDHSPLGMKGEMRPSLEWIRDNLTNCHSMIGLRDIIDSPDKVIKQWSREDIYGVLDRLYDDILIYGSPDVYDTIKNYKFPIGLTKKCHYFNYIGDEHIVRQEKLEAVKDKKRVFVTIGGGDGAGREVIGNYLNMLQKYKGEIDFVTEIVTGPFLPESEWQRLIGQSNDLPVKIYRFLPSTIPYLEGSDLVISTGGYNSVTQILQFARKAVVIPRVLHRKEQLIRAKKLSEEGLLSYLLPDQVNANNLFESVSLALSEKKQPLVDARQKNKIKFNGAQNLADFCGMLISKHRQVLDVS